MRVRVCAIVLALLISSVAAQAGIYFDEIRLTSNRQVLFADNFDGGNLMGWTNLRGANIERIVNRGSALCLSKPGSGSGMASRTLRNAPAAGITELATLVWVPDLGERDAAGKYTRNSFTGSASISLRCGSRDSFSIRISGRTNEPAYRLDMSWYGSVGRDLRTTVSTYLDRPILEPGKWNSLVLRIDPNTSLASVLLDGKELINVFYKPETFQSISSVYLMSTL